ncbi:MAG: dynamin family protein [Ignavibacterium sp.]|nr:dynamin family protein [Ignavibacterium sp.]
MSSLLKFSELRQSSLNILQKLSSEVSNYEETKHFLTSINSTINSIKNDTFTVAVVGVIKRGKSTLLNALLKADKEILSTNVNPETARLSILSYSESPKAEIYTIDNQKINVSFDELPQYTSATELGGKGDKLKLSKTKYAQIFYPNEILKKGFEIVDTPGVEDPDESRSRITLEFIDKADAVIFLMTAIEGGLKDSELKFLKSKVYSNNGSSKGIIFVLNKIGSLRERQLKNDLPILIEKNQNLLKKEFGFDVKIFPIDALEAFNFYRGLISVNETKFIKNFEEFRNYLDDYLVREKGKIFLRIRINKFINEHLNFFLSNLKKLILDKPLGLNEIEKQLKNDEESLIELEKKFNHIENEYFQEKKDLKIWTERTVKEEFNNRIVISVNSINTLTNDLTKTISEISKKVKDRLNKVISNLIDEFELYDIKIERPDFNISIKQLDISNYYSIEQVKHKSSNDGEIAGKIIGSAITAILGSFFPPAIYVGYKLGGFIGSYFDQNEVVENKVRFDAIGLTKEVESIRNQYINSLCHNIDLYFESTMNNIKKLIDQKRKGMKSIYKARKQAYNMKLEDYNNYVNSIKNLIETIQEHKIKLEDIVREVNSL